MLKSHWNGTYYFSPRSRLERSEKFYVVLLVMLLRKLVVGSEVSSERNLCPGIDWSMDVLLDNDSVEASINSQRVTWVESPGPTCYVGSLSSVHICAQVEIFSLWK